MNDNVSKKEAQVVVVKNTMSPMTLSYIMLLL